LIDSQHLKKDTTNVGVLNRMREVVVFVVAAAVVPHEKKR
jgi:hypothetical protein